MAITINGSANTVAGLAVGGLPDGVVDADTLASNAVTNVKVADDAIGVAELSTTGTAGSGNFLRGDNAWQEAGGGKVTQTVFSQIIPTANISTTATGRDDTGLTATITPTKAGSKLLVTANGWQSHMNPLAQTLGAGGQSIFAYVEQNVNSAGFTEPDGTANTSKSHVWSVRDWHDHDYDGRDYPGCFTHIWSPTYSVGNSIVIKITYSAGIGTDDGGTTTKYFHHYGGSGAGALLTLSVSEIEA